MMAASVFTVVFAGAAHGACVPDGSGNMVCSGDESSGIDVTGTGYAPPVTTLYVHDLDGPINPSAGNPGIGLTNGSSLNSTVYSGGGTGGDIIVNVRAVSATAPGVRAVPEPIVLMPWKAFTDRPREATERTAATSR
jgi:hypothetical protein